MTRWNSKELAKRAKRDFEKAWLETKALLPEAKEKKYFPAKGKPHVLFETIQKLRGAYLNLGFEEVVNPLFIEDKEVRRQFGPEALAVLDRCYYLAGLPRPDVGLSEAKLRHIKRLGASVESKEALRKVLHEYKKGRFGGDDLIYRLAGVLRCDDALATKILDEVFPEFKALEPEATRVTLRSHMTSGWFITLESVIKKKALPIKLFSVDRCFRREQSEDATHLRSHNSASCVVASEDASVEDGKAVAQALLEQFGFSEFKFKLDEKRSKYYAPDTQMEVYGKHPSGWVELATFGIYSPVVLSRYGVEIPVMNLGLGAERLAMVLYSYEDIRAMVYPQFYASWQMSDEEIAGMIKAVEAPLTEEGKMLAKKIVEAGEKHANDTAPCEVVVYEGKFLGAEIKVKLAEKEAGKKLLGPAAFNQIYVYGGSIYGLPAGSPQEEFVKQRGGVATGIRYIDAIAQLAACNIEIRATDIEKGNLRGPYYCSTRVGMAKSLGDVNLKLEEVALRYVTTYSKSIDVRGPVFMEVEAEIM